MGAQALRVVGLLPNSHNMPNAFTTGLAHISGISSCLCDFVVSITCLSHINAASSAGAAVRSRRLRIAQAVS